MLDINPAKHGVENPQRRRTEKRPFESWAELDALADERGPRFGPMVIFAAATGLRPGEWVALEYRDLDRKAQVVYVRRSFGKGRLKCTKTESSVRAVPLHRRPRRARAAAVNRRHRTALPGRTGARIHSLIRSRRPGIRIRSLRTDEQYVHGHGDKRGRMGRSTLPVLP